MIQYKITWIHIDSNFMDRESLFAVKKRSQWTNERVKRTNSFQNLTSISLSVNNVNLSHFLPQMLLTYDTFDLSHFWSKTLLTSEFLTSDTIDFTQFKKFVKGQVYEVQSVWGQATEVKCLRSSNEWNFLSGAHKILKMLGQDFQAPCLNISWK